MFKVEVKHQVGDTVWVIDEQSAVQVTIAYIDIRIRQKGPVIVYRFKQGPSDLDEDYVYSTKEELLASL